MVGKMGFSFFFHLLCLTFTITRICSYWCTLETHSMIGCLDSEAVMVADNCVEVKPAMLEFVTFCWNFSHWILLYCRY